MHVKKSWTAVFSLKRLHAKHLANIGFGLCMTNCWTLSNHWRGGWPTVFAKRLESRFICLKYNIETKGNLFRFSVTRCCYKSIKTKLDVFDRLPWLTYLLEKDVTRLEDIALPETEIDEILEHVA